MAGKSSGGARALCPLPGWACSGSSALAGLPRIDATLATARISWTKARLLCRVATPEDEAWPRETVFIRCSVAVQARWYAARQLAHRIAGERLPPWACAENVAAEVLSAIGLEVEPEPKLQPEPARGSAGAPGLSRSPGEAPAVERRPRGAPQRESAID